MNYALVENGIIVNIIVIGAYNVLEFPTAVKVGEIPAGIGDTYHDGKFWRNGVELLSPHAEELARLNAYYTATQAALPQTEKMV